MSTHIRFNDDDDDVEYQPTDSEDELPAKERELLKKARCKGAKYTDSEDEVFGVYEEEESEDTDADKSDLALSDVEGQGDDDDGIPDSKAWGKNKKQYYSTDYVDQDYGGFQGTDATLAELEEQEAKNLQSELAKHLDDDDFALDFVPKELEVEETKEKNNVIKTDVSQLSKRQKLQLLMKESPELFGLIEDYQKRMTVVRDELQPVIKFYKEGKIKKSNAMEFVNSYCQLILNYTVNISMYLLLKAKKASVQNHPIIKRLYQYRQLLAQMDPVFEDQIQPQLEVLLKRVENQLTTSTTANKKKKLLNILKSAKEAEPSTKKRKRGGKEPKSILKHKNADENDTHSGKHITFAPTDANRDESDSDSDGENLPADLKNLDVADSGEPMEDENVEADGDENAKRGITYQIAKNKGLMPSRKKEQRNPRVKHRNKFRKAKIRRKGAVREVRHEVSRYGGEISGIKASVSKSIKLKS